MDKEYMSFDTYIRLNRIFKCFKVFDLNRMLYEIEKVKWDIKDNYKDLKISIRLRFDEKNNVFSYLQLEKIDNLNNEFIDIHYRAITKKEAEDIFYHEFKNSLKVIRKKLIEMNGQSIFDLMTRE